MYIYVCVCVCQLRNRIAFVLRMIILGNNVSGAIPWGTTYDQIKRTRQRKTYNIYNINKI